MSVAEKAVLPNFSRLLNNIHLVVPLSVMGILLVMVLPMPPIMLQTGSFFMKAFDESGRALGGGSHLVIEANKNSREKLIEVDIIKLDDMLPSGREVAIIQLDVEGFEQAALIGAMETIKRYKPILILENLPESWLVI